MKEQKRNKMEKKISEIIQEFLLRRGEKGQNVEKTRIYIFDSDHF